MLILVGIIGAAYLHVLPVKSSSFPLYDKIGHFVLIGSAAALLHLAWRQKRVSLTLPRGRVVLIAAVSLVVGVLSTTEETAQLLSPYRSFDLNDLACNWAGALVLPFVAQWVVAQLRRREIRASFERRGPDMTSDTGFGR